MNHRDEKTEDTKTESVVIPHKTLKLRAIQPDDIRIIYRPKMEDMIQQGDACLTMDFHTEEGWLRIRLVGEGCMTFQKLYKEAMGIRA